MTTQTVTKYRLPPVHKIEQEAFKVYMEGDQLKYWPKEGDSGYPPHVARDHIGLISISLDPREVVDYVEMSLDFNGEIPEPFTVIPTGPFSILLVNNNYRSDTTSPQTFEFDIILTDKDGKTTPADPIIIND